MNHAYDIAHLLAGLMLVTSFLLLYQSRVLALINVFAAHAVLLSLAVAFAGFVQDRHELYITAAIAFAVKAVVLPIALRRIVMNLGMQREIEQVVEVAMSMILGLGLTALSLVLALKVTREASSFTREDLALALAIVLLGFLMMITRRNAVSQVIGFMSIENGLILAASSARGMPLVVEVSVAFSVLIALFVFSVFVFRMRERFDTIDTDALERVRGDRR